ncbi:hypothetical protein CDAR_253981, partial [Caerostris darwini]
MKTFAVEVGKGENNGVNSLHPHSSRQPGGGGDGRKEANNVTNRLNPVIPRTDLG